MPIQNAIVALAELQYGRPDRGLWYLQRMSELCGHAMPWAIPEFEATEGSDRACFMQLWSSAAYNWLMVQGWFRLQPDPDRGIVLVRPQLPSGWQYVHVRNITLWGNSYDLSLQRAGDTIEFSATSLTGGDTNIFRVDSGLQLVTMFV
jgi:glycogen debranching enzyme